MQDDIPLRIKKEPMSDQIAELQAKIWSLESEKTLLNEKMLSLIMSKEKKKANLTSVFHQITTLLRDLQPDSHHTCVAPGSS